MELFVNFAALTIADVMTLRLCFGHDAEIIRTAMDNTTQSTETKPRYIWPWFIAAAVVFAVVVAALAIRAEANRVKQQRQFAIPELTK
jgi:hypothetical protein